MSKFIKPERVLCKRTLILGEDFYYDEETDANLVCREFNKLLKNND